MPLTAEIFVRKTVKSIFAWWQLLLWNIGDGNIVVYSLSADLCSSCKMPHSLFATIFSRPCIKTKIKRTLTLLLVTVALICWTHLRLVVTGVRLANVTHGWPLHGNHLWCWRCDWLGWQGVETECGHRWVADTGDLATVDTDDSLCCVRICLPSLEIHNDVLTTWNINT